MLLADLSTGHTIGLAVVAMIFVGFALASSFLAPRRWPDFPGRNSIGIFAVVCVVLFAAQLTSVIVFGRESEAKGAEHSAGAASQTIAVQESEFRITLPATTTHPPGNYTFEVKNAGTVPHDLTIEGGKITGPAKTPAIAPGATAKLAVSLAAGTYQLYCSLPGHRAAGMDAKLVIG